MLILLQGIRNVRTHERMTTIQLSTRIENELVFARKELFLNRTPEKLYVTQVFAAKVAVLLGSRQTKHKVKK